MLARPLLGRDGVDPDVKSVIVKHSTAFVAINRDIPLDISRCISEQSMLCALDKFPSIGVIGGVSVKTPNLHRFSRETSTQVIQDFSETIDLKAVLASPKADGLLSPHFTASIYKALGAWLRSFHTWTSELRQSDLRSSIGHNRPMRKLKHDITYGSFIEVIEKYPDILGDNRKILEDIQHMAAKELEVAASRGGDEDWGVIHGDFWSGNLLVPNMQFLHRQKPDTSLIVIDWEFAQFGYRAYDLGQMIDDLLERKHFNGTEAAKWAVDGMIEGYGVLADESAFRTAIHVGVQLICWYNRRPPTGPLNGTPEQQRGAIELGPEFIVKGWERDRSWFAASMLACLFSSH